MAESNPFDVVIKLLGVWGAILSSFLAWREITRNTQKLKIVCRLAKYYADDGKGSESLLIALVNVGQRPIQIERIQLILDDNSRLREDHRVNPLQLPARLGEQDVVEFHVGIEALTQTFIALKHMPIITSIHYLDISSSISRVEITASDGHKFPYKLPRNIRRELATVIPRRPVVYKSYGNATMCCVEDCKMSVDYMVIIYKRYSDGHEFVEQNFDHPFICNMHKKMNEALAEHRGGDTYFPYTNSNVDDGITRYVPIEFAKSLTRKDGAEE